MPFKERDTKLIRVKINTWKRLTDMKKETGKTFDEIIIDKMNGFEKL